ncbi:MAG: response regulator [Caldilineaceae bacterium]|nr:response regulator [Caldilineaceae bacterium]
MLLNRWSVFLVASGSIVLVPLLITVQPGEELWLVAIALPMLIIALVTFAAWLSAHNLYSTLRWLNAAYATAKQNEQMARERQAELQQALKELDEAKARTQRMNYMLNLARESAEEARRVKQNFVQTISHELRTPLNLIVGFTELMAQSPDYYGEALPPLYLRDLRIVHRNACHLQSLVNDVLDLARIETAQMSLQPELVDPATLVQDAVNTARSLVEARGLALTVTLEPELPPLFLDPTRIRQVLFNLLNNATRFTEEGGVTVRVYSNANAVTFAMADTGIGIRAEELPHIFEEFYQVDGSTRRRQGGAGLGLAICRRFVALHGGQIWAESQPGQGSTFYFSLPLEQESEPLLRPSGAHRSTWGYVEQGKERILLAVTASATAATLLTRYIYGYRTVVAPTLAQAEGLARQLAPQAIVIDTACHCVAPQELSALTQAWGLPTALIFGCPLPGEEPLRQRLAVDGYLIKPVLRQSLWDVLRQLGERIEHILIVDDNRDFVRLLRQLLKDPVRCYQVTSAHSGQEALAMLRQHRPDLILLDLVLPDLHGHQILEQLRANPAWREIPTVIVSAQDELDNLEPLPGSLFVAKTNGILPGQLVQWIQQVLDHAVAGPVERRDKLEPERG